MLISSLIVTQRLHDLLGKSSDIPLQLSTPIEEATADETGVISRAQAESYFNMLEQATLIMRERVKGWFDLVHEVSDASEIEESEESLRFALTVVQMEVKRMTAMLALLRVAYLKTELSGRWQPYQRELRDYGQMAIRAAAETRYAHIALERALAQWLPAPTNNTDVTLTAEQSKRIVEHSHKVWGLV